ncbi:MAG TPA: NosD domain-containing protein, partial [candidate division Zixibacteria bacterium]|nr:NosD domain-containing protein [candidate division Zixibacteria bacterium]
MSLNKRAVATTFTILLVVSLASLAFHLNLAVSSTVITVSLGGSIQAAIDAAQEGDTVFVEAGQYVGNITVNKSLNLVGENQSTTIIDGGGNPRWGPKPMSVVLVQANYVNISGFTIQNSSYGLSGIVTLALGLPAGGIGLSGSIGCAIRNNTIQDCVAGVAICNGSGKTTVSNNNFAWTFGWSVFSNTPVNVSPVGGDIITDNNISNGIYSSAPNNEITGNQLKGGIHFYTNRSGNNIVSDNTISSFGVLVENASNNVIINNTISGGLTLQYSGNNTLRLNTISGGLTLQYSGNNTLRRDNVSSFDVTGSELSDFLNDIDTSNTVNGSAMYYLLNQSRLLINPFTYPDIGYLGLVNSAYINVWRLTMANNGLGLMLAQTTNSIIDEVSVSGEQEGIYLWNCYNCTIMGSTITSSNYDGIDMNLCRNSTIRGNTLWGNGVYLAGSGNNTFYRNNFIFAPVYLADQLPNQWDDRYSIYPLGWEKRPVGNYWSDYTGQDDGTQTQGMINYVGDGVGDTLLPCHGVDNYPLMKPWLPTLGDLDYNGIVGLSDLVILAMHYGQHYP